MACYFFNISYKVSVFAFPYMFTFVCFNSGEKSCFFKFIFKVLFSSLVWLLQWTDDFEMFRLIGAQIATVVCYRICCWTNIILKEETYLHGWLEKKPWIQSVSPTWESKAKSSASCLTRIFISFCIPVFTYVYIASTGSSLPKYCFAVFILVHTIYSIWSEHLSVLLLEFL